VPVTLCYGGVLSGRAVRKTVEERISEEGQVIGATPLGSRSSHQWERFRGRGKFVVEIGEIKLSSLAMDLYLTALKNASVVVSENGDQKLIAQLFFVRLPIDVEKGSVAACRTVFENVPPQAVAAATDGHV